MSLKRIWLLLVTSTLLCAERGASQHQSNGIADTVVGARISFLPLPILYYTPETGVAGGAALLVSHRANVHDKTLRPSAVTLDFIYTQKKQIIAEVFSDLYLDQGTYHLISAVHYSKYPQKFFGIGKDTPESLEEMYTSRLLRITVDALRKIAGPLSAGLSLYYEHRSLAGMKPDGLLETQTITGNTGGTILGAGMVVHWDTRDNIFMPGTGRYYLLTSRTTISGIGNDFNFSHTSLDLREYLGITGTSTLAFQAVATLTAGNVPFYLLGQIGGGSIMRGYYEGRYRDRKLLAAQAEYRFPIFWRFGGVAFAGVADIAPTFGQLTLRSTKSAYGVGLRYLFDPVEKMRVRLDIGFGKGTSGLYITANEAF